MTETVMQYVEEVVRLAWAVVVVVVAGEIV